MKTEGLEIVEMKIHSVFDAEFAPYGRVLDGYDVSSLLAAMDGIDFPEAGVSYERMIAELEVCGIFADFRDRAYGGMPIELGMCWGRNNRLNCLEYHRDSEINIGAEDFILLLAKECEIVDGMLDTSVVKAFRAPAGAVVEVYATTLHYAPCHVDAAKGFKTAVVLPMGTNAQLPAPVRIGNAEDRRLFACNKWLLAHPDSDEAKSGAYVGLKGANIEL